MLPEHYYNEGEAWDIEPYVDSQEELLELDQIDQPENEAPFIELESAIPERAEFTGEITETVPAFLLKSARGEAA